MVGEWWENGGGILKNIEKPFEHSLSPPQSTKIIYPNPTVGDPYVDSRSLVGHTLLHFFTLFHMF